MMHYPISGEMVNILEMDLLREENKELRKKLTAARQQLEFIVELKEDGQVFAAVNAARAALVELNKE